LHYGCSGSSGENAFVTITEGAPFRLVDNVKTVSGGGNNVIVDVRPLNSSESLQGEVVVSGTIGKQINQIFAYKTVLNPAGYFGGIMENELRQVGISTGAVTIGEKSSGVLLATHISKPLAHILSDL